MKNVFTMTKQANITDATKAVQSFLQNNERMDTQIMVLEDGTRILQARVHNGKFKQFIGMDRAITVKLVQQGDQYLCVEIGESEWLDKAMVTMVSVILFLPLLVTAIAGSYMQKQLPAKIENTIRNYLYEATAA